MPLARVNPPVGGEDPEPKTAGMSSAKLIHVFENGVKAQFFTTNQTLSFYLPQRYPSTVILPYGAG